MELAQTLMGIYRDCQRGQRAGGRRPRRQPGYWRGLHTQDVSWQGPPASKAVVGRRRAAPAEVCPETLLLFAEHRTFCPTPARAMLMALQLERAQNRGGSSRPGRSAPLDRCRRRVIQLEKCPRPRGRVVAYARQRAAPPLITATGQRYAGNAADYARAGAGLLVSSAPYHAAPRMMWR